MLTPKLVVLLSALLASTATTAQAPKPDRCSIGDQCYWAVTGFFGSLTDNNTFSETLTGQADLNTDFQLGGLGVSRELWRLNRHLRFEGELQLVKHVKGQNHWELNGVGTARWVTFPWSRFLRTAFAFGVGLSYASEEPKFEALEKGSSTNLLAYMLVELELGIPDLPSWSVVGRIHHRSTAYNLLFDDDNAASNAVTLGIKYRF